MVFQVLKKCAGEIKGQDQEDSQADVLTQPIKTEQGSQPDEMLST